MSVGTTSRPRVRRPPSSTAQLVLAEAVLANLVIVEVLFLTSGSGKNGVLTIAKFFGPHATLIIVGYARLAEDHTAVPVRVINAGSSADQLDVRGVGGEPFGLGLRRGDASDYRSVPAGGLVLTVGQTGAATTNVPITAGPNQVVTVVLVRTGTALGASVQVDAEGSAAAPGPVHAGLGGAAADRPSGLTGVLVMLAMAAAAAALSGVLARRRETARR